MKNMQSHFWVSFLPLVLLCGCATGGAGIPLEELRTKADQGDPAAQFALGAAYDAGRGVKGDQREAAAWYRKAAEQGYAAAQNSLGWAGSIRRPVEVRVLLARVTCQLTRSWCGRAGSIVPKFTLVAARRTARR